MPIEWITASAPSSSGAYELGESRSARCHVTELAHGGALGEDVMVDQMGSPRLEREVTCQFRAAAAAHILEPGPVRASLPKEK